MADQTGDKAEVALAGPAAEWLRGKADDLGLSEEDLLKRLVAVFRSVDEDETLPTYATKDEVEETKERVADLDETLYEKLEDVRSRVVQVKREADEKAPADHDHPEIEQDVETALDAARAADEEVDDLTARLDDLEAQVEGGFDNFEEVLTYVTDETDELNDKVGTLARVTANLRDGVEHLAAREESRAAAERLAARANEHGVRHADCEECESTVDVGLLSSPICPFCDSTFVGLEPKSGFFGTPTLTVGDRPALEAPAVEEETDVLADLAADAEESEAAVDTKLREEATADE